MVAFLGAASGALFVVSRLADAATHGFVWANLLQPASLVHLGATCLAVPIYRRLRGNRLGARALAWADAAIASLVIGACLAIYALSYRIGDRQLVPILALLLIARPIVLPSRAWRTVVLSAPAPIGILAIQLAHGVVYTVDGSPWPAQGYVGYLLWDQATMLLAIALAAGASRVLYELRVRSYEAAELGRYRIGGRIGGGAIGEVFRAEHALIRAPVAVKILRPEIAGERNLERFEMEVRRTSLLTHPNTVRIFDFGLTADGRFYYAMELLDGADLERLVEVTGPLPASRVIHVLTQACGALGEAHATGLVHCDVKPANLLLCRRGGRYDVLKVLDFGLARNVRGREDPDDDDGAVFGTPMTMAPEVIRGEAVGPAADLYALGAVGYYLATGTHPFSGQSVGEVLSQHVRTEPESPTSRRAGVPADLASCLLSCLAKDPADRPAGAGPLARMLGACADAGGWTDDDAASWWRANASRIEGVVPSLSTGAVAPAAAPSRGAGR